ncbi:MAG: ureidoglycolate lyase [Acetobacteraceae bacterium]
MDIVAGPLDADGFSGFGEIFAVPSTPGRTYADSALSNRRAGALPSLSVVLRPAAPAGPIIARRMERHAFSSQTFVPLGSGRYVVIVAPHDPTGRPAMDRARAFVARPGQCITYGPDVWHHELTVLDEPMAFAVLMWRDGTDRDEEFVEIEPVTIRLV